MNWRIGGTDRTTPILAALGALGWLFMPAPAVAGPLLYDPIPTAPGYAITNLFGQNPTNSAAVGGTNAWAGSANTTVLAVRGAGLSYPAGEWLKSQGGSLCTWSSTNVDTAGRYLFRAIAAPPATGTVYVSVLLQMDTLGAVSAWTTNLQQNGAGFGRTNSVPNNAKLPTNGVYFGFTKLAGGSAGLIMRAGTNDVVLTDTVAAGVPYHCMARIDIGAGTGGREVVSAVLNPAGVMAEPAAWTATTEAEFLSGSNTLAYYGVGGSFATSSNTISYDEFSLSRSFCSEAFTFSNLATFIDGVTTVTVNQATGITVTAQLSFATNDPALYACYGTVEGGALTGSWAFAEQVTAPAVAGPTYTQTLTPGNLAPDTMYACGWVAANGTASQYYPLGSVLNGEVSVAAASDAYEHGTVAGSFTISRPSNASATNGPLTVSYTVGGTAVAGVDYEATLTGTATIPAGAASVAVTVTPRYTPTNAASPTVTLTLTPGRYYVGTAGPASLTIQNADYNAWVAPAPGYASASNNWSQGRVPTAADEILLDASSTNDLTWDAGSNGVPTGVASWTQTSNYTGTVTFPVSYTNVAGATFTNFAVAGNVAINGGTWTHPSNTTSQAYHLQVAIGGDLALGTAARLNVQGKGYGVGRFPTNGAVGVHAGGRDDFAKVYGDVYHPADIGAANSSAGYTGGGAVWLDIAGTATLNGAVNAKATDGDPGPHPAVGAGGSVYIRAQSVSGTGTINASGNGYYTASSGSGGRIAVELTQAASFGMIATNVTARGGWGSTSTGAGTILIKTATQPYGTLIVDNFAVRSYGCQPPSKYGTTCISAGQTWTFDAIVFRNYGVLSVPTGTTLRLPNGLASVSGTGATPQAGILYMGGAIVLGDGTPYTFTSNWIFQADSPYVITGNVQVARGGALGCIPFLRNTLASYARMNLTVIGDLDIATNGMLVANNAGIDNTSFANATKGYHGGQSATDTTNKAYGSLLNPALPGGLAQSGDLATIQAGGGAVLLTVSGNLNVNGPVSATSAAGGFWPGAGGSINIRAGTLTGTGSIRANGGPAGSSTYGGGGGRVAVRLTATNAFGSFAITNITASGSSTGNTNASYMSSAGTVYLQTAADAEGAGQIIIRNDNSRSNTASVTWFPALVSGGETDVLDKASCYLQSCAAVRLTRTLALQSASIETNSTLDLNGYTLSLKTLTVNGRTLPSGLYAAADIPAALKDASTDKTGRIVIMIPGSLLEVR